MFLKHPTAIELDHCAYYLRGASRQGFAIAASKEGQISPFAIGTAPRICINRHSKIQAVCLHPTEKLLALVDDETRRLSVLRFDGSLVFEENGPDRPLWASEYFRPGFADCFFDENGDFLWCAVTRTEEGVEIQLRETNGWSIVNTALIEDPFGASSYSIHRTCTPETVALFLGAGQDGQQVFWLTREAGNLRWAFESMLENTTPPAFSTTGKWFWVTTAHGEACRFEYPQIHQIGTWESPNGKEDRFDYWLCCLNDRYALALTWNGRLCLLDSQKPRVSDEVIIEGHEPRPAVEYYKHRVGEKHLCTDILFLDRIGQMVILLYRFDWGLPGTGPEGWKDALLCFSVESILEQIAA